MMKIFKSIIFLFRWRLTIAPNAFRFAASKSFLAQPFKHFEEWINKPLGIIESTKVIRFFFDLSVFAVDFCLYGLLLLHLLVFLLRWNVWLLVVNWLLKHVLREFLFTFACFVHLCLELFYFSVYCLGIRTIKSNYFQVFQHRICFIEISELDITCYFSDQRLFILGVNFLGLFNHLQGPIISLLLDKAQR